MSQVSGYKQKYQSAISAITFQLMHYLEGKRELVLVMHSN